MPLETLDSDHWYQLYVKEAAKVEAYRKELDELARATIAGCIAWQEERERAEISYYNALDAIGDAW